MSIFLDIKEAIPARAVLENFLGPSRGSWRCPFHEDRTPSFSAHGSAIVCFGCGWRGDLFCFLEDYLKVDRRESLRIAAGLAGITLPDRPKRKRKGLWLPSLRASHLQVRREIDGLLYELEQAAAAVWRKAWEERGTNRLWEAVAVGSFLDRKIAEARQ